MTYDEMRKDYERMRDVEKAKNVDEWKAANGYDDLLAAYAEATRELEEARAFLRRTAMEGGSIVSSAAISRRRAPAPACRQSRRTICVAPIAHGCAMPASTRRRAHRSSATRRA
jgi:hypothetical protein